MFVTVALVTLPPTYLDRKYNNIYAYSLFNIKYNIL